jgi:DNA-binding NarL/FixJ family response regulator
MLPVALPTRILLADDHPVFRRGLRETLAAEADMEVVAEAGDGATALQLADEKEIDLAILDVLMPRLTGLQAARKLAKRRPEVQILMLSSSADEEHIRASFQAGAAGYLVKSAAESEVTDACRAIMNGETVYPPGSAALLDGGRSELLTPRELEVLKLVAEGWSSRRIADELVISRNTVDRHRQNLLEKLGLHDRVELTRYAIRRGLVEP